MILLAVPYCIPTPVGLWRPGFSQDPDAQTLIRDCLELQNLRGFRTTIMCGAEEHIIGIYVRLPPDNIADGALSRIAYGQNIA